MDFVCFEGFILLCHEPHALADKVSYSIKAARVVLVKWLIRLGFCCYSTASLLGFELVLITPQLWPLIFISL